MIVRFGFCLLQYEHDPWLHERLNVGVLLFSQGANFLRLKTRGWEGRIFGAYPSLERSNFTEDLKQIERSAARYLKSDFVEPRFSENNSHVDVLELKEQDIVQLANRISPDLDKLSVGIRGSRRVQISGSKARRAFPTLRCTLRQAEEIGQSNRPTGLGSIG